MTLLETALDYHRAGCVVTPTDKEGKPRIAPWSKYSDKIQSVEDVTQDFSNYGAEGIAILCGENHYEALDLDSKNWLDDEVMQDLFERYANNLAKQRGLADIQEWGMHEEMSKSGGWHYVYRFMGENKSDVIAKRPATEEELQINPHNKFAVLIEILGKGHTCTVCPTPGYEDIRFNLTSLSFLSAEQRQVLIDTAKLFNSYEPKEEVVEVKQTKEEVQVSRNPWRKSSWDDYNEKVTEREILGILELNGWKIHSTKPNQVRLTRPGAKDSTGVDAFFDRSKKVLFVKSTSSDMYRQNRSGQDQPWMPHQIYAHYQHQDDYSKASRTLYEQGYGDRIELPNTTHQIKTSPLRSPYISSQIDIEEYKEDTPVITIEDEKRRALKTKLSELLWNPAIPLEKPEPVLTYQPNTYSQPMMMATAGSIITISGQEKAGKTIFCRSLIASALAPYYRPLGFKLQFDYGKICYFNTEEEETFFRWGNESTQAMAGYGIDERLDNFEPYNLTAIGDPDYKMDLIKERVLSGDVSCVFIDQVGDLMFDPNDKRETTKIKDYLFQLKETGTTIVLLLHLNPGSDKEQGSIGTEVRRKSTSVLQTRIIDNGVFNLHCKFQRGRAKPFTDIVFGRDERGYLYEMQNYMTGDF